MGDTTHSTIFPILSPIKYIFPHQKPPRKGYAFRGGSPSSIIFRVDFKVALGGDCRWGRLRGPGCPPRCGLQLRHSHTFYFALGKHFCRFNVVQQGAVALFVMLFNGSPPGGTGQPVRGSPLPQPSWQSCHTYRSIRNFSPAAAAFRLSAVSPMPFSSLNHSLACSFFVISRFQKQCCDLLKTLLFWPRRQRRCTCCVLRIRPQMRSSGFFSLWVPAYLFITFSLLIV